LWIFLLWNDCGLFFCFASLSSAFDSQGIARPKMGLQSIRVSLWGRGWDFDGSESMTLSACPGSGTGRRGEWELDGSSRTTEEPRNGLTTHTRRAIRETSGKSRLQAPHAKGIVLEKM
jgi:hypothetical protein